MPEKDDFKTILAEHISKTGYPLEIEIASILEQNGWEIIPTRCTLILMSISNERSTY